MKIRKLLNVLIVSASLSLLPSQANAFELQGLLDFFKSVVEFSDRTGSDKPDPQNTDRTGSDKPDPE